MVVIHASGVSCGHPYSFKVSRCLESHSEGTVDPESGIMTTLDFRVQLKVSSESGVLIREYHCIITPDVP
jgi:hypothetical protein